MRVPAGARCWVAEQSEIIAGLCLTEMGNGHWLTGLWVDPTERQRGVATRLVAEATALTQGPVWLFCEPRLMAFYRRLGFNASPMLPEPLASRLSRYNRSKTLVALCNDNEKTRCPL